MPVFIQVQLTLIECEKYWFTSMKEEISIDLHSKSTKSLRQLVLVLHTINTRKKAFEEANKEASWLVNRETHIGNLYENTLISLTWSLLK